ncbi:MAG: NAD(P)-binding domain-containing protein [Solirubrobacterales bacterium]|nr:NAD(P)-binding domain-containing protein [Solirubrobacterales bacterium]
MSGQTRVYRDEDADVERIRGRRVAILGFGNQGAAQAQNLRDSGVTAIRIGNRDDEYRDAALAAGFEVVSLTEAATWGEIVFLLVPDEVQPAVFGNEVGPGLQPGDALVVASGYNVAFGLLDAPEGVDLVMVAPRMIGASVRERYQAAEPYPCFVSVERDRSGEALSIALAIGRAIGATRGGAVASSAREEAALDLFSEQALWPMILAALGSAYEVLHDAGFSDAAILNELYLSGEPAEIFTQMAEQGLFEQLPLHSHTSQYGQLRALLAGIGDGLQERFSRVLHHEILSGAFAREWSDVLTEDPEALQRMHARARELPIARAEARVRAAPSAGGT